MTKRVTVIGAANVDIIATPIGTYVPCESNPGHVHIGYGGVGRNIAHNLCLLGMQVRFITAIGDDASAASLLTDCRSIGMTVEPLLRIAGARSNYFICINNEHGEMQGGIADMELVNQLSADMVAAHLDIINSGDAVVADCNIDEAVLWLLSGRCTVPLYIDATSAAKAVKILPLLSLTHQSPFIIKVNRAEAVALSGINDVSEAARWFVEHGVTRIYITLGSEGVLARDAAAEVRLPAIPITVANATGAGDAFMAAVVAAETRGETMQVAATEGLEAAAITLQCDTAVSDNIKLIIK